MYACYRREDAASAETMLDAAAVVLAQYPEGVVRSVTHPVTGLPGRLKWPPNIAEIREACEIAHAPIVAAEARAAAARKVAELRAAEQAMPRAPRPSYEELKARHGPNWGIAPPPDAAQQPLGFYRSDRPLTDEERQAMYAKRIA